MLSQQKALCDLKVGEKALVSGFKTPEMSGDDLKSAESILCHIIEMGFLEGSTVQVAHIAPFGKMPIAVLVNGHLVGIGLEESRYIFVHTIS